ncbi:MAG: hemerythrin domain-containing protein [Spirochaetes bacterium]|nr:hemerythrin domain-containing protein [Spirochaetota bacterium]
MHPIIEKLKKEHQLILHAFKNIKKIGPETRISGKILSSIKNDLIEHLSNEDENIYPVLKHAAVNDKYTNKIVELFVSEMEALSTTILQFFEKYHDKEADKDFLKEFDIIFTALEKRIVKEENILFEEYNKCIN